MYVPGRGGESEKSAQPASTPIKGGVRRADEPQMDEFLSTWYLSLAPASFLAGIITATTVELNNVRRRLGGRIASEEDLEAVHTAIHYTLGLAAVVRDTAAVVVGIIVVAVLSGTLDPMTALLHDVTLAAILCAFALCGRRPEREIARFDVVGADPTLATRYHLTLVQWRGNRATD
jgi:hypothetical protein